MADSGDVSRELNKVKSVGQARAAAGAALKYLTAVYKVLDGISAKELGFFTDVNRGLRDSHRRALDSARSGIETLYAKLGTKAELAVDPSTWSAMRSAITRAYVEAAGVEGAAGAQASVSGLAIIGDAIANAPSVAVKAAGKAVGATLKEAGAAVGAGVGGIFSGLGWVGSAIAILIVALLVTGRLKGVV